MKINVTKSSMPSFEEYIYEIKELWDSHWLTNNGTKHLQFQNQLKRFLTTQNISLYTNGHLALEAAISMFDFPQGSEIITTPFTFVSTTNAIVRCGMIPRFCDINDKDFTIDVNKIESLINEKTVAILPVHVYGNICNVEEIEKIAKKHNLKVIYDAAHAFGVKYKGVGIANFGDVVMFSFHATKVFNTIEGGCICFKDPSFKQLVEDMKNFGIRDEEHCLYVGGNAKMNEFQASMGICNLRHIDECIENRRKAVIQYRKRLSNINGIYMIPDQPNVEHNYSYMPVVFDGYKFDRNKIKEMLAEHSIGARKYFYPLTSQFDCYKSFDKGDTPVAKRISEHILTLPLFSDITQEEVDKICDIILG
ncbi:MAG: DegT/DnrJ/EryC1/StrS family aminotransferase [Clostridia bacterium]|nr:DegT/DnrJ/EryC1/StrS family aminotransferase [Clostridia bacterium]